MAERRRRGPYKRYLQDPTPKQTLCNWRQKGITLDDVPPTDTANEENDCMESTALATELEESESEPEDISVVSFDEVSPASYEPTPTSGDESTPTSPPRVDEEPPVSPASYEPSGDESTPTSPPRVDGEPRLV